MTKNQAKPAENTTKLAEKMSEPAKIYLYWPKHN